MKGFVPVLAGCRGCVGGTDWTDCGDWRDCAEKNEDAEEGGAEAAKGELPFCVACGENERKGFVDCWLCAEIGDPVGKDCTVDAVGWGITD